MVFLTLVQESQLPAKKEKPILTFQMIGLETERLIFRQWQKTDYPEVADFFSTEANARYVGGVKTAEESWILMATYIGHYELNGFSYLAITEKDTGHLIGTVGLWKSPHWPEHELGYWLLPQFQGKGYGIEAGLAVKEYALNTLQFDSLVSYIASSNTASKKLAERLGAQFDTTIDLLNFGPHGVYRYQ
jgi:RimJ/RimL family protein N-acetyltransferase